MRLDERSIATLRGGGIGWGLPAAIGAKLAAMAVFMAGQANVRAGVLRRVGCLAGLVFFGRQGRQREEREDENQWDPK